MFHRLLVWYCSYCATQPGLQKENKTCWLSGRPRVYRFNSHLYYQGTLSVSDYSIERLNELCCKNKVGWVDGRKTAPVTQSTPEWGHLSNYVVRNFRPLNQATHVKHLKKDEKCATKSPVSFHSPTSNTTTPLSSTGMCLGYFQTQTRIHFNS